MDIQYIGLRLHERGFKDWFLFFFEEVEGYSFILEPIHEDLFRCFQDIYDGKTARQVINVPPRSAKTSMSIYFIAYALAKNMKCNFIYTSFSQELLATNSRRLAIILNNPLYVDMYFNNSQEIDIEDTVVDDFWREYYKLNEMNSFKFTSKQITTNQGGVILFNSIGASITGFGAGLRGAKTFSGCLCIDDANKPIEAHSEKIRNKVVRYFEETLLSRLNNSNTPIINIQQRLHLEDLSGFLIKEYNFSVLKKPLIENGICQIPNQYTQKRIEELKKNNYLFTSQYQQEPIQLGGFLIKTELFKKYKEPNKRYKQLYIVCDTAFSTKTSADNSAFMLVGITLENNDLHILDMYVGKMNFVELKNNLLNFYRKSLAIYGKYNTISSIYIENKASGQSLIQELKYNSNNILPIKELYPTYYNTKLKKEQTTDKYTRYLEVSSDIEAGYVYLPEQSDWVLDFISECESFDGLGTYKDDRVDCLIYALKVRRNSNNIDWKETLNLIKEYSSF